MVCTNNQVALYDFNLAAKTHKSITKIEIPYILSVAACHFEPMACTLFLVDKSGQCVVMFLNMRLFKNKATKSLLTQHFFLDISLKDDVVHTESLLPETLNDAFLAQDHSAFKNL